MKVEPVTRGPRHHFFGYYDKCPWDSTGRYMLALEVGFMDRPPSPSDRVTIGIIDLVEDNRWIPIAETRAWNWQQGCMLQWLPSAPHRRIIYNDRRDRKFISIVMDVWSREKYELPLPVYALSPDGRYALTLNFSRLQWARPGYGYPGVPDPWRADPHPKHDGIYLMDLESGNYELIISLNEIVKFKPKLSMKKTVHWFNHLLFNKSGNRFVFLHRWRRGKQEWYTRMLTADRDGTDLYCVADDDMVSHFDWRDSKHILAWAHQYDVGDRFFLFRDLSREREIVGEGVLTRNGHCSYSPDGRWILTDTYPDSENMRSLFLYDTKKEKLITLGKFFSPPELRGEIRCDLHPRWSRDGKKVCIDSAHEGSRQVYVVDVSKIVTTGI
ncbi:MAG: hypothetical protein DRJ51_05465 [Thermoprotei archaeon]|nr:MAG: hypothetical protein DRJ51_05465 [Thermoprotei archaeon]RLF03339.1 MAG: hypothetical protein DRJ59_00995 [Thermoprotei archaeon]